MVYSYAITSNVFSFFDFCGVAGARAHERSSEGVFFLVPARQFSSSAVPARARGPLVPGSTRGSPGSTPPHRPGPTRLMPGHVCTPRGRARHRHRHITYQIELRRDFASPRTRRGTALPAHVKTGARFDGHIKNRIRQRARSTNRSLTKSVSNRILL